MSEPVGAEECRLCGGDGKAAYGNPCIRCGGTGLEDYPVATEDVAQGGGVGGLEPVEGDLLPPVGSKVLIHLASPDAWVEHTVAGYYVWGDLSGDKHLHRVFVRVVSDGGYPNARLLCDVKPLPAAPAIANQEAQ